MTKGYMLRMPKKVFCGTNCLNNIKDVIYETNSKKILLLTDKGILNAGLIDKVMSVLESMEITVEIISDLPTEPKVKEVESIIEKIKNVEVDLMIAVGGGSVIDVTKLLAVSKVSSYRVSEMVKDSNIIEKGVKTLMIPTTAGTGAEATPNAIVTIPEQELKVGIVNDHLIADYVILAPELTTGLPKHITASTGIDALAHALECYISKKSNPFSDLFAIEAIKLIFNNLEQAYNNGDDLEARSNMLRASFYGGVCIASSSTVAVHALAYPLGGKYGIAHGVSNAMLLAEVMNFNKSEIEDKLSTIADVLDMSCDNKENKAQAVINAIYTLVENINIPNNLEQYGIGEEDIDDMVEGAAKVTRLLDNNPKKMTKEDIKNIYKKLIN